MKDYDFTTNSRFELKTRIRYISHQKFFDIRQQYWYDNSELLSLHPDSLKSGQKLPDSIMTGNIKFRCWYTTPLVKSKRHNFCELKSFCSFFIKYSLEDYDPVHSHPCVPELMEHARVRANGGNYMRSVLN